MIQNLAAVRDHYQAAIVDVHAMLAQIAERLDSIEGPITAERIANFDRFHLGGLAATAEAWVCRRS
jgi:hypothetical protein